MLHGQTYLGLQVTCVLQRTGRFTRVHKMLGSVQFTHSGVCPNLNS